MNKIRYFALPILITSMIGCTSNGGNDHGSYDGVNLHVISSDKSLDTFINDFTHRNMRYDQDMCGEFMVTHGTGFAKNWETMAVTFQNSTKEAYREDKFDRLVSYYRQATQDDYGMIYNTPLGYDPYEAEAGHDETGYACHQGWPFPTWNNSTSTVLDNGNLDCVGATAFEFNDTYDSQNKNWKAEGGTFSTSTVDEYKYAAFSASNVNSFKFYRNDLDALLPMYDGINTLFAPFIDIDIEYTGTNVDDYYITWQVEGDSTWYRVSQRELATIRDDNKNGHCRNRSFISMYLNEHWNHQIVTSLGVEFRAQEGKKMTITDGKINYLRPNYDTRQSNATYQFILSIYNYYIYTRDTEFLEAFLPKTRKAFLFLTDALKGKEGLLDIGYLYGHDGVSMYCDPSRPYDRLAYHGVGNGYWDITAMPMMNLEANIYFYQSINALKVLEEAASKEHLNIPNVKVRNAYPGGEDIYYNYDKDSLTELANNFRSLFERNINVVAKEYDTTYSAGEYYYANNGGFYNPATGRFALGINEMNGSITDAGYLYLNLEAICAGLGTEEQRLSIMNWVDGQRIVEGDDVTGNDIYFYEFAPMNNTKDATNYLSFTSEESLNYLKDDYGDPLSSFHRQVQNGGAVIAWSYYDIVARAKVLGYENAWKRINQIKTWYNKVLKESRGRGLNFYGDYYDTLEYKNSRENPDQMYYYSLQASGVRGPGALGLDAEFIESVILIRALPESIFGLDPSSYNNLTLTYGLSKDIKKYEEFNLKYGDCTYAISEGKNTIEIFDINGVVRKEFKITFRYKTNNPNTKVKVDGRVLTSGTYYQDGYMMVTLPFTNVKVEFN